MLLLETSIVASYAPVLAIYMTRSLRFSESEMSSVFMTGPVASLLAPLFVGWLADRYFAAQKVLSLLNALRAVSLIAAAVSENYPSFIAALAATHLLAFPSMVLGSAISFRHLSDARGFGGIRVWGAVSWIVVVWGISLFLSRVPSSEQPEYTRYTFLFAAGFAAISSVYCLTLPETSPNRGHSPWAFVDAFKLLRGRSFAVLVGVAFVASVSMPFIMMLQGLYFTDAKTGLGLDVATANLASTIGQSLELVLFPLLGFFMHRYGVRSVVFVGMVAWPLRFAAYMLKEPVWLVIGAQLLHGCNVVFGSIGITVTVDLLARRDLRASAQGLLAMLSVGLGALFGQLLCGMLYAAYSDLGGGHDWTKIYGFPFVISLCGSFLFLWLFRESDVRESAAERVR